MLPDSFKNIITKGQGAGWRTLGKALNQKRQLTTFTSKAFGLPALTTEILLF